MKSNPLRPPRIMILRDIDESLQSKEIVRQISQYLDVVGVVASSCIKEEVENKSELGKLMHENSLIFNKVH